MRALAFPVPLHTNLPRLDVWLSVASLVGKDALSQQHPELGREY